MLAEGALGAVTFELAPMPGFLAGPKPARGLETAALGTNSPPILVGGADGRDRKGPVVISSDICRGLSLNNTGSVRSSSFPASYTMVSKRKEEKGVIRG